MPLQESLAFHPQTTTIVACNFKIEVSAFFITPILLLIKGAKKFGKKFVSILPFSATRPSSVTQQPNNPLGVH